MGTASFLKGTTIAMTSGTLALGGNTTFSAGALLSQSGGIFKMPANSTLSFEGGGTASIQSNATAAGMTLRVTSGGKLTVANFFNIAGGSSGTLLVDGGTSSFSVVPSASPQGSLWGANSGGAATVTFSNGAVGDLSSDLSLGLAAGNGQARVNVLSGARLAVPNFVTGVMAADLRRSPLPAGL